MDAGALSVTYVTVQAPVGQLGTAGAGLGMMEGMITPVHELSTSGRGLHRLQRPLIVEVNIGHHRHACLVEDLLQGLRVLALRHRHPHEIRPGRGQHLPNRFFGST